MEQREEWLLDWDDTFNISFINSYLNLDIVSGKLSAFTLKLVHRELEVTDCKEGFERDYN